MKATLRVIVSSLFLSSLVIIATPSAAQTTRTLTVTPETGLLDGDVVALEGSGFTPSDTVYFCQGIVDGTPGPEDCGGPISSSSANNVGKFSSNYTVRRFMSQEEDERCQKYNVLRTSTRTSPSRESERELPSRSIRDALTVGTVRGRAAQDPECRV